MYKKLLNRIAISLALIGVFAFSLVPATVSAAGKDDICRGVNLASGASGTNCDPVGTTTIESTIATVINLLSLVVGVVAVIMVIIGGLKYIMSSGDASNVTSAKNTILYALIGLVVVALAQIIVRFVLNKVG